MKLVGIIEVPLPIEVVGMKVLIIGGMDDVLRIVAVLVVLPVVVVSTPSSVLLDGGALDDGGTEDELVMVLAMS
jgi:hypothetical protein